MALTKTLIPKCQIQLDIQKSKQQTNHYYYTLCYHIDKKTIELIPEEKGIEFGLSSILIYDLPIVHTEKLNITRTIDLASDSQHCGSLNNHVPKGMYCVDGIISATPKPRSKEDLIDIKIVASVSFSKRIYSVGDFGNPEQSIQILSGIPGNSIKIGETISVKDRGPGGSDELGLFPRTNGFLWTKISEIPHWIYYPDKNTLVRDITRDWIVVY